jgi:hypothetical protein
MDKEKIIAGIVGGVVAGFSIGVGFYLAQRTLGKRLSKLKLNKMRQTLRQ